MPYQGGRIKIDTPATGSPVVVEVPFRVAGTTGLRVFIGPHGEVEDFIPSQVTFSVDGGTPERATPLGVDWEDWEANPQVSLPGPHTIQVVARWDNLPGNFRATDTINVSAIDSENPDLVEPAGAVSLVEFP